MCLSTITDPKPKRKSGYAWKLMRVTRRGRFRFPFRDGKSVPSGVWLKAKPNRARGDKTIGWPPYPAGFHCFWTKEQVMRFQPGTGMTLVRVRVRGVHTIGEQYSAEVIVANEMKILHPVKLNAKA